MKRQLNVLIADNSEDFGIHCQKMLASYGINANICEKDGIILYEKIIDSKPDVVLADLFMPGIDSIGILTGIIVVRIVGFIGRKTIFSFLSLEKGR